MPTADFLAQELAPVAEEVLAKCEVIAAAAKEESDLFARAPQDVFANTSNSTFTSPPTASALLSDGRQKLRNDLEHLLREPAIARVLYEDDGAECISYVCRATPPIIPGLAVVSQRAPKGRLAALEVGQTVTLQNGKKLKILNRLEIHPHRVASGWDSENNVYRLPGKRPITIESLAALLGTTVAIVQDLLSQLVAEESQKDIIREGQKRAILTSMQLRDQAILDAHQDEIFRLPIDEQIFLSGPPGTGKTTTLIRRLGQKLDSRYLTEDEAQKVQSAVLSSTIDHSSSWIMFTPTELLRQYVKEAFIRERIPASDSHIRTWEEFRRDAARNTFSILRSAVKKKGLIFPPKTATTDSIASTEQRAFFDDFDLWQRQHLLDVIRSSAVALELVNAGGPVEAAKQIRRASEKGTVENLADLIILINRHSSELRTFSEQLRESINVPIEGALNQRMNRDGQFVQNLATVLQQAAPVDEGELDDLTEDEDEDDEESAVGLLAAVNAYKSALRALARSQVMKKRIRAGSRIALVLENVGTNDLEPQNLVRIGDALIMLGHARGLLAMGRRFIFDTPKRYRSFRRTRQKEARWFRSDMPLTSEINQLELDSVLLASLRASRDLLGSIEVRSNLNDRSWTYLQPVFSLYRNQVLADEATDFSPIQLACMMALTHPSLNSFFVAGDFNQRLSSNGVANIDELLWVAPRISRREITAIFRQSHRLQQLANSILNTFEHEPVVSDTSADTVGDEVPPVLLESHGSRALQAEWLAERIREIEASLGQVPTLAVFVSDESDVEPLTQELNRQFANDNLQAVACVRGQIIGQDTDVRVFDIRHVKGLEFEAAFFVGIDVLARQLPVDFARYLYVGATRAATYLGITCESGLPESIASLQPQFVPDWIAR